MDSKYKRFVTSFCLYRFFKDFAFIYAVYVILFKLRGLSVLEISLLLAIWSAFVVIFEVPTGALSDMWNRKYMLLIGLLSKATGFGVWYFADSFWLFALGFILWGAQETFCSGSQEALLFDNLKKFKKEKEYDKIAGKGHFYSKIAIATSLFLGGFIAAYSFPLVITLSSVSMLIAMIPVLFFSEVKVKKSAEQIKCWHYIRDALKESVKNKQILRLILYSAVVLAIIGTLDEYEQLYFDWIGLPLSFFGVVAAAILIIEAVGAKIAHHFQKQFTTENNIYVLSIFAGILLVLSQTYQHLIILLLFILVFLLAGISEVLVESRLQKQIKTEQRATIVSINSLLLNLSATLQVLIFGIISEVSTLNWGFIAFGVIAIMFSIAAMVLSKKRVAR